MTLQKDTIARDAVEINGYFIEDLIPYNRFATLTATGREQNTYNPDTGDYDTKTITVKYVISCTSEGMFRVYSTYLQHLLNKVDADIVFNDEYDKFMIGDIRDKGFTEKHGVWALGEYEIICKNPFKYGKEIKTVQASQVSGSNDKQTTGSFRYAGTKNTSPLIKIHMGNKSDSRGILSEYNNNSFINIVNSVTNKHMYIGNMSTLENIASNIYALDMSKATTASLTMNGWSPIGQSSSLITSFSDPYYNKGEGLTYKAYVPSEWINNGTSWQNFNCGAFKNFSSAIDNFIFNFNIRMWAENPTDCGATGFYVTSNRATITGIFFVKDNMSTFSGKVYYIINQVVVGSDIIDFSKYNDFCGLSGRQQASTASLADGGRRYFADDVVNNPRKNNGLIERKIINNYVYTEPNTNIQVSKMGDIYTFKVGDSITRTFSYKREDNLSLQYSSVTMGFKNNIFYNESYATDYTMTLQITGLHLISLNDSVLLNNDFILSGDTNFLVNTEKNAVYKSKFGDTGLYSPEYQEDMANIQDFYLDHRLQKIDFEYYAVNSDEQPIIEIKYNEVYV